MASPASFGDVFLVGSLALKLGRAFTKGRKSAPAEFREVENQLYSLNVALSALERVRAEGNAAISIDQSRLAGASLPRQADAGDSVGTMVRSCEETLKHLEAIVEKYGDIAAPRDAGQPMLKRWNRALRDNWKKIAWASEGGDLATLMSQLSVHINSLNLVLGVVIKYGGPPADHPTKHKLTKDSSQTSRLEDHVNKVSTMLREIHEWFVDNLKEATFSNREVVSVSQTQNPPLQDLSFELYIKTDQGLRLLCDHTSLYPKWNEKPSGGAAGSMTASDHLFICSCPDVAQNNDVAPHHENLAAYGCEYIFFGSVEFC
jgi:hypothetical protein